MAIIDSLPGIEITIESQGKTLPEYKDDTEWGQWHNIQDYALLPEDWALRYVECESDTDFEIKICIQPSFKMESDQLGFNVLVDGKSIGIKSVSQYTFPYTFRIYESYELLSATEVCRRTLKFASVEKVDEADSAKITSDAKAVAGMGEIQVGMYWSRKEEWTNQIPNSRLKNAPAEIAEKALKGQAISHGVSFGEERREHRAAHRAILIDGFRNPLGVMVFRYRSREALQQELIVPRSPSPDMIMGPVNPRNPNGNEESQEDRIARLQRELNQAKAEVGIKHEDVSNDRKRKGDSDLLPPREYKTIREHNTLIYDLTDDD